MSSRAIVSNMLNNKAGQNAEIGKTGKVAAAASLFTALNLGVALSKEIRTKHDERRLYYVSISEDTTGYAALLEWLDHNITGIKSVKLASGSKGKITRQYDGDGSSKVKIKGYNLKVTVSRPDAGDAGKAFMTGRAGYKIQFSSTNPRAIDAVEELLKELVEEIKKNNKKTFIYNAESSYGWEGREFTGRLMDSVFLPDGEKGVLCNDIDKFFSSEARYAKIGAPWHRGYMFYGEPGNGKSSLVAAISDKYRMSIYNLPLSSVKNDQELLTLITAISPKSILLLEDVDIFSKSMGREQGESGPTLAGLLNALDGVSTPHGLLTIMTTNRVETLDPALTRRGRMDYKLELVAPDRSQVEEMFSYVYDQPLGVEPKAFSCVADLSAIMKENIDDAEGARLAIKGV